MSGSIALVEQQPYIYSGTIKENILFGREFNKMKYDLVITSCCLETDLAELPNGQQTEIGEKGINISGGQKARISLARAVYSNADIYLLDDPLSAVDSKVAKSLFDGVIKGVLRNKTIILVTHQLHFTKKSDKIIIFDKGTIIDQGSYEKLQRKIVQMGGAMMNDTNPEID